jgi:hypothetical protein
LDSRVAFPTVSGFSPKSGSDGKVCPNGTHRFLGFLRVKAEIHPITNKTSSTFFLWMLSGQLHSVLSTARNNDDESYSNSGKGEEYILLCTKGMVLLLRRSVVEDDDDDNDSHDIYAADQSLFCRSGKESFCFVP